MKMREISITRKTFLHVSTAWVGLFVLLASTSFNPFGLLYFIGIPLMLFFSGYLTVLLLPINKLNSASRTVLSVGLSILWLLVVGLLGNWLLPFLWIDRPLDTAPLLFLVMVLLGALIYAVYVRFTPRFISIPRYVVGHTRFDVVMVCMALAFLALSIVGPLRLNHGGGNGYVMTLLLGLSLFGAYLFRHAERVSASVLPFLLYLISLALLLMTSLRGWFISGHDIQREFFVFQLAKDAGLWSHAAYVDAYNACLSITILPTMLANTLHVPDVYIYKVLFQMLFALVAVIVFLLSRKWLETRTAVLATLFFVIFPTFFQDMPFLIRQEIAFLFFGLMLLVLFEESIALWLRQALFMCMGVGVILSHYSTTYTILFIFGLVSFSLVLIGRGRGMATRMLTRISPVNVQFLPQRKITVAMVTVLFLLSVLWTSVITDTDGHVKDVSRNIWSAIQGGFDGSAHSPDVFVFFTFSRGETHRTLPDYINTEVNEMRAQAPDVYYATSTYEMYPFSHRTEQEVPPTAFGALTIGNIPLGELVISFGKVLAKVMQITVPIGLLYVLLRKKWIRTVDGEMYLLAGFSVLFIVLCIVVPLLSREYGVFRAMQQSMFVLAPFMVVGTLVVGRGVAWIVEQWCAFFRLTPRLIDTEYVYRIAGVLMVLFFLYATGFLAQLVGGNIPAVHLNNLGNDFDHYVVTTDEAVAIEWLYSRVEDDRRRTGRIPLVHADRFGKKKLQAVLETPVSGDIFPGSIQKDAYVFIGPAILGGGTAVLMYGGDLLRYEYPIEFLEENKEVVFRNATVRIYK